MVELIEYILVFGISLGVAGVGIALVNGMAPGLNQMVSASQSEQVAGAARIAVVEGQNVTLLLPLTNATISCASGFLSVAINGPAQTYQLGYPCSFAFEALTGQCNLVFSEDEGSAVLSMEATC
jgi:hypothetical protein